MATCLLIVVLASVGWAGESLTEEQQIQIIEDYMLVTRQRPAELMAAQDDHDDSLPSLTYKCGTPAILRFVTNYDRLDQGLLKSLGVQLISRDTLLTDSIDSPKGLFRVHYTTLGADALYGGAETAAQIADIMDSVYAYIVDTLGYPAPPQDGYEPGGDEKYDVYMVNLGSLFYGMTYADSLAYGEFQHATSFIELNSDPRRLFGYENRPMDAIRVTAAHEFFHAVQFGIDWGEAEDIDTENERRYWMEMSAVWMEEEIYDDINDYYYYLDHFFNVPEYSIQRFQGLLDLHPYASAVFPIYLSERFGRDIIRDIWLLCGELGFGPSFLLAANSAILEASGHAQDWVSAFSEFALWNYMTGERADLTIWVGDDTVMIPGYSEKEAYPAIPFEKLHAHYKYPETVVANENLRESPRHNGAYYLSLHLLETADIVPDTTLWVCDTGAGEFPNCADSFQVGDTLGWGDPWYSYAVNVDTFFNIYLALGNFDVHTLPRPWGVNIIYQLEEAPDSLIVDRFFADDDAAYQIDLPDHAEYRSLTFILTPASTNRAFYEVPQHRIMWVGYGINESNYDSLLVEVPGAVLDPYPNPAVVEQMDRPRVTFRLTVPTDSASYPMYGLPFVAQDTYLQIDVYTVAGERIKTVIRNDPQDERTGIQQREGEFLADWDLTNESGADVASGVYLVYARLFNNAKRGVLLAEDHTKLLVVR